MHSLGSTSDFSITHFKTLWCEIVAREFHTETNRNRALKGVQPAGGPGWGLYNLSIPVRGEAAMSQTQIAVWEPVPYWVPELQRILFDQDVRIVGLPTELEVTAKLNSAMSDLVLAPGTDSRFPLASFAMWTTRVARVHVILASSHHQLRWFLRELGASSVFDFAEARDHLGSHIRQSITGQVTTVTPPAISR